MNYLDEVNVTNLRKKKNKKKKSFRMDDVTCSASHQTAGVSQIGNVIQK